MRHATNGSICDEMLYLPLSMVLSPHLSQGDQHSSGGSDPKPHAAEPSKHSEENGKRIRKITGSRPPMGWLGALVLLLGTVILWCVLFKIAFYLLHLLRS